ncbi:MAG: CPBP family intramembrane metalloprotease [Lachnospiraceae bacterium]|nr:CPBP family intramembrane metalloprotease [Lachnospiraceae bacterium]
MGPDQQPDTAGLSLNGVLGYVFGGCLLQLLKEKSGSIWLPVLVHCLADYSIILKY